MVMNPSKSVIQHISFNENEEYFACGTESGFSIYSSKPYMRTFSHFFDAGISGVAINLESETIALVGGGKYPRYPANKVILWDCERKKSIKELIFKFNVKSIKLCRNHLIIGLERHIYVYQLPELGIFQAVETSFNPQGLCAASNKGPLMIVCLGKKEGDIQIFNYGSRIITTHSIFNVSISGLAITHNGYLCAVSSEDGRYIRIVNMSTGNTVQQLYCGPNKSVIQHLSFDPTNKWLACSTDKDVIRVFFIRKSSVKIKKTGIENYDLEYMEKRSACFSFETSVAEFRVPHPDSKAIVGFKDSQLIIVTRGGYYYRVNVNKDGKCKLETTKSIYNDV